ncbi:MAG: CAP domain-containing protein [Pseudomonadota bacterium]
MLELVNQFRMDPGGEYNRLVGESAAVDQTLSQFNVNLNALRTQLASIDPTAPLAWNGALAESAAAHNAAMIQADLQSHQVPGEAPLRDRVAAEGYTNWSRISENTFAYADDVFYGHAALVIDWGFGPDGMQAIPGHRLALSSAGLTEVGIGVTFENNPATRVGDTIVTQDFGTRRDYKAKILGVVIDDKDNDNFYDVGEGLGGVKVTLVGGGQTYTTTTWASGGYQIAVPAGTYQITYSGAKLDGVVTATTSIGSENVKIDVEKDDAVDASPPPPPDPDPEPDPDPQPDPDPKPDPDPEPDVGGDGEHLVGDGRANRILGGAEDDVIEGKGSRDSLIGGSGDDSIYGGDGEDRLVGGLGHDDLNGGAGVDRLSGQNGDDDLLGGGGGDMLYGGHGDDTIDGGSGGDYIKGEAGNDVVFGGADSDEVRGDHGNDTVGGGAGTDTIAGGSGNDVFFFTARDGVERVLDYQDGVDKFEIESGANRFADLSIKQKGADVWIEFAGTRAVLVTESADKIDASDFIFS